MLLTKQSSLAVIIGLFPSIYYIFKTNEIETRKYILLTFYSVIVSFLIGGWFYLYQYSNYGSVVSFPRESAGFEFSNHEKGYYTNFDLQEVYKNPIKYHNEPRLLQILYTDTWGDYWGYFSFDRSESENLQHMKTVIKKLSRVMIYSLVPSIIFIAGFYTSFLELFWIYLEEKRYINSAFFACCNFHIFQLYLFYYSISLLYGWKLQH